MGAGGNGGGGYDPYAVGIGGGRQGRVNRQGRGNSPYSRYTVKKY